GVDLKTAQEPLSHADSRIMLDVYTRDVSATRREANDRVLKMVLESVTRRYIQHPRRVENRTTKKALRPLAPFPAPSEVPLDFSICHKPSIFFWFMARITGLVAPA